MIGDKIKEERLKKDMTQGELGKAIDVSASTIGMYEQNRRQPDIATLIKLSNFFNVSSDYLLSRTDNKERNPYKEENKDKPKEEIITIAAHHTGDKFTDDEKKEIDDFMRKYVLGNKDDK